MQKYASDQQNGKRRSIGISIERRTISCLPSSGSFLSLFCARKHRRRILGSLATMRSTTGRRHCGDSELVSCSRNYRENGNIVGMYRFKFAKDSFIYAAFTETQHYDLSFFNSKYKISYLKTECGKNRAKI